jgi:Imidazoleglycerol-phosphate dehydratase
LEVDDHHLIEDLGISLGMAFKDALKDKKKIRRFGNAKIPMDESIADIALDIDGRGFFKFNAEFGGEKIGAVSSNMIEHFFESFSRNAGITIHVSADGKNDHHKAEAIFKAFGVGLDEATGIDDRIVEIKSTKGVL